MPARQGQAEAGTVAGTAPGFQPAAVQPGVFGGDRQPKAAAAGGPRTGRISPPEPVEDPGSVVLAHADAVVTHGDTHGVGVRRDGDLHGFAFSVFQGVDHEVPYDPLNPAGIGVDHHPLLPADDPDL